MFAGYVARNFENNVRYVENRQYRVVSILRVQFEIFIKAGNPSVT